MPRRYRKYRRRRSGKSKLADRKINTLIEKRIKTIAKQEDSKKAGYIVTRDYITANATWGSNIQQPLTNNYKVANANNVGYKLISQFATGIANTGLDADSGGAPRRVKVNVKTVQAQLTLINMYPQVIHWRVCILYVPNFNNNTSAANDLLLPNIHMMGLSPNRKFNGIFGYNQMLKNNGTAGDTGVQATIVASKTIRQKPMDVINLHSKEMFEFSVPPDAGSDTAADGKQFEEIETFKLPATNDITLTKTYKKGKTLYGNASAAGNTIIFGNGNYFLAWCHDCAVPATEDYYAALYGVAGMKIDIPQVSGYQVPG